MGNLSTLSSTSLRSTAPAMARYSRFGRARRPAPWAKWSTWSECSTCASFNTLQAYTHTLTATVHCRRILKALSSRAAQDETRSLGCSKRAELAMLQYSKSLVGKPFSNTGMARSIVYPRQTDGQSFFCAELVAAVLKRGGLMSSNSNPGAATPQSLHKLYSRQAAITANPYTLRQFNSNSATIAPRMSASFVVDSGVSLSRAGTTQSFNSSLMLRPDQAPSSSSRSHSTALRRDVSPPRALFRCVAPNGTLQTKSGGAQPRYYAVASS